MAKRPKAIDALNPDPTARTAPQGEPPAEDKMMPIGVGLLHSEGERLKEIAAELGTNRHKLLLFIVRDFMRRYEAGERPPTETRKVLKT